MNKLLTLLSLSLLIFSQDLPVDSTVVQGKLANGLKYFIKENNNPSDKTELWLQIGSGSLDEQKHQQGLAHYLEHLAFNGSANFPSGSLVKYFESLGLKFGRHQNAFTSFERTAYTLSLPQSNLDILDKSLLCLSDYAYRLNLDEEEIDKERNIILEEKRLRNGANRRFWNAYLKELFPASRVAKRFPIGIERTINTLSQKDFKQFYQQWYRPHNATLIIVGNFNSQEVETLIKKHFSSWLAKEVTPSLESGIIPNEKRKIAVINDKEFNNTTILLSNTFLEKPAHTKEYHNNQLLENLIHYIIDLRFQKALQRGDIPFKAGTYNFNFVQNANIFVASAEGEFKDWQKMLRSLINEIRRVQQFGFSIEEFMLGQKHFLALADQAVRTEKTKTSGEIINQLGSLINQKRLPLSCSQELQLLQQFFKTHTLQQINTYFNTHYNLDTLSVIAKVPEKEQQPTNQQIQAVIEKALEEKIEPVKSQFTSKKLFSQKLKGGSVVDTKIGKRLPITSLILDNNIIVNHYYSELKKEQIYVTVTIPAGQLQENNKGVQKALLTAFNTPATKNLTSSDLNYLLTGKNFSISAQGERDSLRLNLSSSKEHLDIALKTLYLLLTEAKLEMAEFKIWKEREQQNIDKINYEIERKHWAKFSELISYNDSRFTYITQKELDELQLSKTQKQLDEIIQRPLEVAITGDIDLQTARKLATKYFGSLSHRPKVQYYPELRILKKSIYPSSTIQDLDSKSKKSLILLAWRFQDYHNLKARLALELVTHIIDTKLNEEIREKKSLTYSINFSLLAHESLPERGMLYCTFSSEPSKSQQNLKLAQEVIQQFKNNSPSQLQLDIARKQSLHILERRQKKLGYWSNWLSGMNYRQRDYDFPAQKIELLQGITLEDIQKALQTTLIDKNFFSLITKSKEN